MNIYVAKFSDGIYRQVRAERMHISDHDGRTILRIAGRMIAVFASDVSVWALSLDIDEAEYEGPQDEEFEE